MVSWLLWKQCTCFSFRIWSKWKRHPLLNVDWDFAKSRFARNRTLSSLDASLLPTTLLWCFGFSCGILLHKCINCNFSVVIIRFKSKIANFIRLRNSQDFFSTRKVDKFWFYQIMREKSCFCCCWNIWNYELRMPNVPEFDHIVFFCFTCLFKLWIMQYTANHAQWITAQIKRMVFLSSDLNCPINQKVIWTW